MPYIDADSRLHIDAGFAPRTMGELSYVLYREALVYILNHPPVCFQRIAEATKALQVAERELERRYMDPHEESRRLKNGDVFPERKEME